MQSAITGAARRAPNIRGSAGIGGRAGAFLLAAFLSAAVAAAPIAANAASYYYAVSLPRTENQWASETGPGHTIRSGHGTMTSSWSQIRLIVVNAKGSGVMLGSGYCDGCQVHFYHPLFGPGYGAARWDFKGGSVSGQISVTGWTAN
jgi:hypothetical protein